MFPNVQFIVSTHSPLIVGGLDYSEVERFYITDGKIQKADFDPDMTLGRTDQVLTGELFSLPSTLDVTTQKLMEEYKQLLGNSKRDKDQEKKFFKLQSQVEARIPPTASRLIERRATQLLDVLLEADTSGLEPEQRKRMLESMGSLLKAIQKEVGDDQNQL